MTTPAEDLVTTLGATFSNKFYPSVAPAGVAEPYAVYLLVSGDALPDFDGGASLINCHWQLDIFGRSKLVVDALADSAMTTMDAATLFKSVFLNRQDVWEDSAQYYRVLLEFSTWR